MARRALPRKASFQRGPSTAQRAGLVLLGVLVGALAGEGACRLSYRPPWHEWLSDDDGRSNPPGSVHRNSIGLRDIDYASPKPPGVKRVLFLGSSFVFGSGVSRDDSIFPELVEHRLAGALRAREQEVEVLTGAIPGSLTGDWVDLFARVGPLFQPDVVVVVFSVRDGTSLASMLDFTGAIRNGIVRRNRESLLYRHSYLWRAFRDGLDHRQVASDHLREVNLAYIGNEKQAREWARARENVLKIAAKSEEMGARFGFVVFPVLSELDGNRYPFEHVCRLISQFGHVQGWPTLDLLPSFLGQDEADLRVSPVDLQPNELAHRIAADALVPFVRALLDRSVAPTPGGSPEEAPSFPQA